MSNEQKSTEWLSLSEAAKRLNIHVTTLRRWADAGEIPVMLTPGRHRRFAVSDLDSFAQDRRRLKTISGLEHIWIEQAMSQTRREIVTLDQSGRLSMFDEKDREHKRILGRRLMGVMLQYISLHEGGDDLLKEARAIGHEHAEEALAASMPLTDAMRIIMFFRDTLMDSALQLPEVAQVHPEANNRLMRRLNTLLNTVELAVAETYDRSK
jgi:excisionase family DNA binding protein